MQLKWIKVWLGGLIALIFALVNVSAMQSVHASTLKDGTYSVPVSVMQDGNGTPGADASIAQPYFARSATVVASNGTYQVTITTSDQKKIMQGVTVNGQSALKDNSVSFTLSEPTTNVKIAFDLEINMLGMPKPMKKTESAWLVFDWSNVPTVTAPATSEVNEGTSSVVTTPTKDNTTPAKSADSTPVASSAPSSSSTSAKTKTNDAKKTSTTPTTKATTTKAKTTRSALDTTGWTYEVLQADNNQVSAANKFYTHAAKVTKVGNHYQVQLTVKYAKNSGMQARGFKPITTDGEAAQNVVYGTSGNNYLVTYTFNVNKLSDLNQLIKGTVHVAVPTVGINQDFTVRFKFSHQGTAINHAADSAQAVPTSNKTTKNGSTNGDAADTATGNHHGNLPQTSERRTVLASVLGLVTLLAVSGAVIYRKSRVMK